MSKKAIVTGAYGQDGSLMVDYLLERTNLEVYGMVRPATISQRRGLKSNLDQAILNPRFTLLPLDAANEGHIAKALEYVRPDYYLNFAAQTDVLASKETPGTTMQVNYLGVARALNEIRKLNKPIRFFNAGSSEEFSPAEYSPQTEVHPHFSCNPYGESKVCAHAEIHRARLDGIFAIQPYLYNHFSSRATGNFLPVKIVKEFMRMRAAAFKNGDLSTIPPLVIGNRETIRDYTAAEEVVEAIWLSINADNPNDYIISSGRATRVSELVEACFKLIGPVRWWEEGLFAYVGNGRWKVAESSWDFYRPSEDVALVGNADLIYRALGWKACKPLEQVFLEMIKKEIDALGKKE